MMRQLKRLDDVRGEITLIACKRHSPMILERWKTLYFEGISVEEVDTKEQCVMCPQAAGV